MKQLIAVVIIIISMSVKAQEQHKFKSCDNYHFMLDYGYTVNEAVIADVVISINGDSVVFNTPVISETNQLGFKIDRREEDKDEHGNKLTMLVVNDTKSHVEIKIVMTGDKLYTSFEN